MLDGDHYVLNGVKIYVTSGGRADLVVVWATLDRARGRAAIRSFMVGKNPPGFELVRLEHKLGIRACDTAAFVFNNCRVPKENLLGDPQVNLDQGFAGVMQTFDNTRPLVAPMAVGLPDDAGGGWPTNRQPHSLQASMAKAGRTCVNVALGCVELAGVAGHAEGENGAGLLEKWARDAKILDIFEGTQQISC